MLGVQVDLIVRTVEPEAYGAFGLAAIEVIDQQGLHLLCHASVVPLGELMHSVDDQLSGALSPHRACVVLLDGVTQFADDEAD